MGKNAWQERIFRAEALARNYPFAAEILNFYCAVAAFHQRLFQCIEHASANSNNVGTVMGVSLVERAPLHRRAADSSTDDPNKKDVALFVAGPPELSVLLAGFPEFLALVEKHGPPNLADAARQLCAAPSKTHTELLNEFWNSPRSSFNDSDPNDFDTSGSPTDEFFARACLQPYAEFIRIHTNASSNGYTGSLCPFCGRKPGVAVLRPLGDGGQRRLVCSFCLGEWEFRRILCASCGEEDHKKLPVYTAEQFPHVRVDSCDRCHRYLKTVDLTKAGLADAIVDELATAPLDLWAREHGYEKLELNLLQL